MGRGINWLPFDQYIAENSRRPCMVKGCSGLRDGKSGYCTPHKRKNTIWGHPLGYSVRPHEFEQEVEDIRKLLKLNPDHPGVAFGIQWLDKTFKLAAGGADVGGSGAGFWFALLHRYHEKFETKELLIRLAGLMLLYERDPDHRGDQKLQALGRHDWPSHCLHAGPHRRGETFIKVLPNYGSAYPEAFGGAAAQYSQRY